jgi:NADPH-dependent 2,4-dienoyl-CoA reductase/sulfur reductase-like enzyme/rhodanese-related sulfurtransferase
MKLVIIGGVAGGASAATRARRLDEQAQIVMFERSEHISFANCGLPYHVGGVIERREQLVVMTPSRLKERAAIEVRTSQEVTRINPHAKTVSVLDRVTGNSYEESYDKLIVATGSRPKKPAIPGIDDPDVMVMWNLTDMTEVKDRINDGIKRALIIGGGYIGLEMAENFRHQGLETVLIQRSGQLMSVIDPEMAQPLASCLRRNGVSIHFNTTVLRIGRQSRGADEDETELQAELSNGLTITTDLILVAAGIHPNSELVVAAGLAVGEHGGVVVNAQLQTSDPDIYAVGDVIEVTETVTGAQAQIPLAGPANRQGRMAADNALGGNRSFRGSMGTSICKVFDLTVANAGPSEKTLRKKKIPYRKVYLNPFSHATYYPHAQPMHMKLLFSPEGLALGAQIVGTDGVKERIDVLATAIQAKLDVATLAELELAYAPPYGSAKEPVNYAGFLAVNLLEGKTELVDADTIPAEALLLDVREPSEFKAGAIPGAVLVPLGQLRSQMAELPRDRGLVVYCQVGIRGYIAERILRQNGFSVRNLSGGYTTWKLFHPDPAGDKPGTVATLAAKDLNIAESANDGSL